MISQIFKRWRERARLLKAETYALYLAYKDPRVAWYAKAVAACVVAYAFSPIDLIPDPIPVLGYVDDLILVPLGISLAIKMIPSDVLAECREKAQKDLDRGKQVNWIAAGVIIIIWLLFATIAVVFVWRLIR